MKKVVIGALLIVLCLIWVGSKFSRRTRAGSQEASRKPVLSQPDSILLQDIRRVPAQAVPPRTNPAVTMEDVVPGWTLRKDVNYREYEAAAKASFDTLTVAQVPELRVFAALLSSVGVPDDQLHTVVRLAYEGATLRARVEKRIEGHREEMQAQVGKILAGAGSDESKVASLERYRKLGSSWSQILERELKTTVAEGIRKMSEGASGLDLGVATNLLFINPRLPAEPLLGL